MPLPTRTIGTSAVPYPGLGCMGLSSGWYATSGKEEANMELLKAAYDSGVRFWDTSDIYGKAMGENEQLIGKAMKLHNIPRKDVFLATKFGFFGSPKGEMKITGRPDYVMTAIEKSLNNLGSDYVDLYYQHRMDPQTPIEDTVRALKELQDAGKIKYIGLSECSVDTLRRACKVTKIDAVQVEYSLFELGPETTGLLDVCKELDVAFVAYSPLGRGMLTGQIKSFDNLPLDDTRRWMPRFSEENFPKNLVLVERLKELAQKKGCTIGQLALAWVPGQWDGIFTIPGTTRLAALQENIGSAYVSLSTEELAEIRKVLDSFTVQGLRYPDAYMAGVNI